MRVPLKENTIELSVVIPALREAPNLRILLPQLREALSGHVGTWEVLVVDGDSGDGSEEAVAAGGDGFRYIHETEPGYGKAILRGVSEARGAYILTMDADLSHPAEFFNGLWASRERADIVIASRYVPGGGADQPWARQQLSRVLNVFFGYGLSVPVRDMSSGYRLYRKHLFYGIELEYTNFVILIEILLKALAGGRTVWEMPFQYRPRKEGVSNARILRFGIDYLRLFAAIWRIRNSVSFPDYDWRAHDSRIWLQRYWQRKRLQMVLSYIRTDGLLCDVGCGSSRILASLPEAIGVDIRHDKLAFMRATNQRLVQSDGLRLPFVDGQFKCVLCSQVIEHIPNENGMLLDELSRILTPGGTLVLGTPDYGNWEWLLTEWLYRKAAPGAYGDEHLTRYSRESLHEALKLRGFTILDECHILRGEYIVKAEKAGK